MTTATPHAAHHTAAEHSHTTGCGHVSVPHGDHVDYATTVTCTAPTTTTTTSANPPGTPNAPRTPTPNGEGCGHVAVPHGDHVDYVHDGHRHAAHDGRWDDH